MYSEPPALNLLDLGERVSSVSVQSTLRLTGCCSSSACASRGERPKVRISPRPVGGNGDVPARCQTRRWHSFRSSTRSRKPSRRSQYWDFSVALLSSRSTGPSLGGKTVEVAGQRDFEAIDAQIEGVLATADAQFLIASPIPTNDMNVAEEIIEAFNKVNKLDFYLPITQY